MHPVLLDWRGIRIHSYSALLYLGMVFGLTAGNYMANLAGLDPLRVLVAMLLLTIIGLVGARLLYVAIHWRLYLQEPMRIWRRSEGGAAQLGGLFVMVPLSVPLLHALEIPLLPFLDISTFTLLTALAFGKVGCLLNGCCCGRPTAGWLSVNSPNRLGLWRPRIPSQLLESAAAWTLLLCAAVLWSQRPFPGAVFMAGAAAYGFIRVILQGTQETQDVLMGINVQKALAGVLGVLATGGLMIGLTASD